MAVVETVFVRVAVVKVVGALLKVNQRRVFKLHISAEAYTKDHEGYTMDYDDGAMAIRCLKDVVYSL